MIMLSLPKSHPEDLIHAFIYGLKPSLLPLMKAQVAQKEEPILPEAMIVVVHKKKKKKKKKQHKYVRDIQPQ